MGGFARILMAQLLHTVFILLGTNLGDRLTTLQHAREAISEAVGPVLLQSSLYEMAAWGITDQPSYLNQVLKVLTPFSPEEVLQSTQAIELRLGRVRREKWGSRVIDIDLLYFDSISLATDRLTLPHPFLHQRRFPLVPLAEVAPELIHPLLQKTSRQLLEECRDTGSVQRLTSA